MDKLWKTIGSVVPGPAVLLAGKWINLFSATHLTYPDWQEDADRIAIGAAAVVAVALAIALKDTSKAILKALVWVGLALVLAGLVICWLIWFHLGKPMQPEDALWFQNMWEGIYITTMVTLVATITVGALSLREDKPKTFWTIAIISALIVIGLAMAVFAWWH